MSKLQNAAIKTHILNIFAASKTSTCKWDFQEYAPFLHVSVQITIFLDFPSFSSNLDYSEPQKKSVQGVRGVFFVRGRGGALACAHADTDTHEHTHTKPEKRLLPLKPCGSLTKALLKCNSGKSNWVLRSI